MENRNLTITNFTPEPFLDIPVGLAQFEQIKDKSGLEQLQLLLAGKLPAPSMAVSSRTWISSVSEGFAEFRGDPSEQFLNPMGIIHGGWTMTLLDSVLGCAVQTVLRPSQAYASAGTEVKFIRPVTPRSGQVRAIGKVDSRGTNLATASALIHDQKGRLLATGTTTCFITTLE